MSDEEKIILFPTDRIVNKETAKQDPKAGEKVRIERTREFVEGAVNDIAMNVLKQFVDISLQTNRAEFTKDFGLFVDILRGLIYRDFDVSHPAQRLADKIVNVKMSKYGPQVVIDYNRILPEENHKPHQPIDKDLKNELKWHNDEWQDFEADFDLPEEPDEK